MSVSTTSNRSDQVGDGATDAFSYTFPVYTKSDLRVYVNGTLKTITTHYTQTPVNLAGGAAGGTVTFTVGNIPALNDDVLLIRVVPLTQATVFSNLDRVDAKSAIEGTFDYGAMIDQQHEEQLGRSLHYPISTTGASGIIPDPNDSTKHGVLVLTTTGVSTALIVSTTTIGIPVTVPFGGTGTTTNTNHGVLIGQGTSAIIGVVGNDNTLLQGQGTSADPLFTSTPNISTITATTVTALGAGTFNNLFVSTVASMSALKVSTVATVTAIIVTTLGAAVSVYTSTDGILRGVALGTAGTLLHGGAAAPTFTPATESDIVLADVTTNNVTQLTHGFATKIASAASDAAAGELGEFVTTTAVTAGTAVTITNDVAANVTSIALATGDWDVVGSIGFQPAGTTVTTQCIGWVSATSAAYPGVPNDAGIVQLAVNFPTGNAAAALTFGPKRFSVSATTTVFLSGQSSFTVSASSVYGYVRARRVR